MVGALSDLTGLFEKMPREEYDALPHHNYSTLKYLERSPFAYRYHKDNPTPPTKPMILGNASHLAILEPDMAKFSIWEGKVRRGKEWEMWKELNHGCTMLNVKEAEYVMGMRDAVHAHGLASKYLRHAKTEITILWRDPVLKRLVKARPDAWIEIDDEPVLVSLKTTADCRDFRFGGQYAKMCYHAQDALYQAGFYYLSHTLPRMVTIAVENKPPHEIAVYSIGTEILRSGQQLVSKWVDLLAQCEEEGEWPAAVEGEVPLVLPSWAVPDGDFSFSDLVAIGE